MSPTNTGARPGQIIPGLFRPGFVGVTNGLATPVAFVGQATFPVPSIQLPGPFAWDVTATDINAGLGGSESDINANLGGSESDVNANLGGSWTDANLLGGSWTDANLLGGSETDANLYGGSWSDANALGGSFTDAHAGYGGSEADANAGFGGTATEINAYSGSFTETNEYGGTATDANELGDGGSEVTPNLYSGTFTDTNLLAGTWTDTNLLGFTLEGFTTMQSVNITLSENNDETIDLVITNNGTAFNLTGYSLKAYLKTAAGIADTDPSTVVLSSSGGSPAITVTSETGGTATLVIPHADLENTSFNFWRLDVINSSTLQSTAMYGTVTMRAL